jgi:hypothetical protein
MKGESYFLGNSPVEEIKKRENMPINNLRTKELNIKLNTLKGAELRR